LKADYALISMKHLAIRQDAGSSSSAREIAESYEIPLELLAKVLQRLVRSRLLISVQGTRGGYRLARHAASIPVAWKIRGRIVEALTNVSIADLISDDEAMANAETATVSRMTFLS
jgi:Rrf2 family protein